MEENATRIPSEQFEPENNAETTLTPEELRQQRRVIIIAIVSGLVILAFLILAVIFLLQDGERTTVIRDIFIILMALEFMIVGWVLVVLVIQLARLINLLQNELRPILNSTNEAANTLRGTAQFISDNLAEPVVKLNSYMAAFKRILEIIKISR
jgi:predicted PurR-regulated permease PerM